MKKQFVIAVGVLLSLGTAVSATLNEGSQTTKPGLTVEAMAPQMGSKQSAQIVALWNAHASSSGSVPLARPL